MMKTYKKGSARGGGMNGASAESGKRTRGLAGKGVTNTSRSSDGMLADKTRSNNSGVAALRSGPVKNPTGKRTRPL